jgi:excisionase family DNA binding protein
MAPFSLHLARSGRCSVPNDDSDRAILAQFGGRSLSLAQASRALRVSRRTLYYWIKEGRVRTIRTSMGSQRVLVASVRSSRLERNELRSDRRWDGFRTDSCGGPPTEA